VLQKFDERNRDLVVNINGDLVHRERARISPFDSSVQGGDAVWEGLRLYRGRIFRLEQHLDRLVRSAKALAFTEIPTRDAITREIQRTLAANGMFDGVHIRLTLTRGVKLTSGMDPRLNTQGPTLIVLAEHKAPVYSKDGLALVTSSVRRFPPDCLDPRIHHNNLLQSCAASSPRRTRPTSSSSSAARCARRGSSRARKALPARLSWTCVSRTAFLARKSISRSRRPTLRTRCSARVRWANWPR
jgi:hypothetical protein